MGNNHVNQILSLNRFIFFTLNVPQLTVLPHHGDIISDLTINGVSSDSRLLRQIPSQVDLRVDVDGINLVT